MKVKAPAIKVRSGKIVTAGPGQHHDDIGKSGKRGFKLSDGSFVGRQAAAKVANAAGQVKPKDEGVKVLHSRHLKGR